jgi:DNA primase
VTDQPVVFLGSEGEAVVVARDLSGLLWLLAQGYGPVEVAMPQWRRDDWSAVERPGMVEIAKQYAPGQRRPVEEVVVAAQQEFPDFEHFYLATRGS